MGRAPSSVGQDSVGALSPHHLCAQRQVTRQILLPLCTGGTAAPFPLVCVSAFPDPTANPLAVCPEEARSKVQAGTSGHGVQTPARSSSRPCDEPLSPASKFQPHQPDSVTLPASSQHEHWASCSLRLTNTSQTPPCGTRPAPRGPACPSCGIARRAMACLVTGSARSTRFNKTLLHQFCAGTVLGTAHTACPWCPRAHG